MTNKTDLIENRLLERRTEDGIDCSVARGIAEELDVSYGEVGDAANRLNIKIRNCELGCF